MQDHDAARLFLCVRCCSQVVLCSPCDRGQRYCSQACSKATRRDHQRDAGRRYQAGSEGRVKHVERSRRWRLSQKQKRHTVVEDSLQSVTHQGPHKPDDAGSGAQALTSDREQPEQASQVIHTHCWKCAAPLQPWLRQRFLRHGRRRHGSKGNCPSAAVNPSHIRPPPQAL
jgi:hypothetical protein